MNKKEKSINLILNFVNKLLPGSFDQANQYLDKHCIYKYENKNLSGPEIIKSFKLNHEHAATKFSKIVYCPAKPENIILKYENWQVALTDWVWLGKVKHIHKDSLWFKLNKDSSKILEILHQPIKNEKERMKQFLKQNMAK